MGESSFSLRWLSPVRIPAVYKSSEADCSKEDSLILRIVRQNQMAKTQSVSSFQWACSLKSLKSSGINESCDVLMAKYDNHPEVRSTLSLHDTGKEDDDDEGDTGTGCGSIALKGRMKQGVRNFLERTY